MSVSFRFFSLSDAGVRVRDSLWPIAQIVLTATLAFLIAREVVGNIFPVLAVLVSISSLGFSRDTRPIRVLTTVFAMVLGLAISDVMLIIFGPGLFQLMIVIALAALAARFVSNNAAFAVTVTLQATLVQMLPEPEAGFLSRPLDGLIGGTIALLVTALLPRNPLKLVRTETRQLFQEFRNSLTSLRSVLEHPDQTQSQLALAQIRASQSVLDSCQLAIDSARAITKVSPLYRKVRVDVEASADVVSNMDLAIRNLRVIARRVDYLTADGKPRPKLASIFSSFEATAFLLSESSQDFSAVRNAQRQLRRLSLRLGPDSELSVGELGLLLQLRPLWVDLAAASGIERDHARSMLPALSD